MRAFIFGTGKIYQTYRSKIDLTKIIGFLDNDINKQGNVLDGLKIQSPNIVLYTSFDKIYLCSAYYAEMFQQLKQLGVSIKQIIVVKHWRDIFGIHKISPIQICGNPFLLKRTLKESRKNILLISHQMDLTGAPIALFSMARVLKANGYGVVIATLERGPLITKILDMDIPVIIHDDLRYISLAEGNCWIKQFSLVIINTVVLWYLLREQHLPSPVIWWLHEMGKGNYSADCCDEIRRIQADNLSIYGVGPLAIKAYNTCVGGNRAKELLYGLEDCYKRKRVKQNKKMIFAIIGTVVEGKAQDIFVRAAKQLLLKKNSEMEFWIIGRNDSKFGQEIINSCSDILAIRILGLLDHATLLDKYQDIDVLVCPSREDSMPIVVTESMMNYIPSIVSSNTGTAAFITPQVNGLVCRVNDIDDLAHQMEWCIDNPNLVPKMGIEARKIYDKYFSMKIFENNLMKIIDAYHL